MTSREKQLPSKKDLLNVIAKERKKLESLIEGLSEVQMNEPGVEGNWSIKDLMAHIAAWERLALDRISSALTGESLKFPVIEGESFVDKFNADIYKLNHNKDLLDIHMEFSNSHKDFIDQIEKLEDFFLSSQLPFDWAGNMTVQVMISANTHWHYVEHVEAIEQWIQRKND